MGIESDQLVYDYLSRVGDLAQQRQMPSGTRMELVSSLRGEIDRRRARAPLDNPASVRRILGRLGTPDEVVSAAGDGRGPGSGAGPGSVGRAAAPAPDPGPAPRRGLFSRPAPERRTDEGEAAPGPAPDGGPRAELPAQRVRRRIPRPRRAAAPEPPKAAPPFPAAPGARPPHLAGMDELGPSGADVDWWSVSPAPSGPGEQVTGFTGGVEIPEILVPPPSDDDPDAAAKKDAQTAKDAPPGSLARRLLRPLRRPPFGRRPAAETSSPPPAGKTAAAPGAGIAHPFLLLAAALLVGGALFDFLLALGLGWLLAYGSRRLTAAQRKFAVLGLPGAALATALLWLWGRAAGHWGAPIPDRGMGEVLAGTWPWTLKGAALASALYLAWRSRRA